MGSADEENRLTRTAQVWRNASITVNNGYLCIRIVTWIDANAPFYGTHRGKNNLRWQNEPDFRPSSVAMGIR